MASKNTPSKSNKSQSKRSSSASRKKQKNTPAPVLDEDSRNDILGVTITAIAIALAIASMLGRPVLSTSATDPHGEVFEDPSLLHDCYHKTVDAVVDGGSVPGKASSVVSLIDDIPEIIRYGAGDVDIFE